MSAPVVLVTGCPRSGTTIVGECIAQAPGARYLFEPLSLRGEHVEAVAEWFRRTPSGRWVVKAPFLVFDASQLLLRVPDLRVVVVERDWRDTVASLWAGRQREAARGHEPWDLQRCLRQVQHARLATAPMHGDPRVQFAPFESFVGWPGSYAWATWEWLGWARPGAATSIKRVQASVSNSTSGYHAKRQDTHYMPHRWRIGRWQELPEPQRTRLEEMEWEN